MQILVFGVLLFCAAFCTHVIWWRTKLPTRQMRALVILFFCFYVGTFTLGLGVELLFCPGLLNSIFPLGTLGSSLYITVLYSCLTAMYVLTYPGIEAESPSGLMLLAVESSKDAGITRSEFNQVITHTLFVGNRIENLVSSGFVKIEGGRMQATKKGLRLLRLFQLPRKFVGPTQVGG